MAVCDPFLSDYLEKGKIIEKVDLTGEVTGVFLKAGEEKFPLLNYPYRLLCYRKDDGELLFTVDLETSVFGTCCLGAHSKDCHHNFGPADKDMGYEDFKEKAIDIAMKLIKDGAFWENISLEDLKPYLLE